MPASSWRRRRSATVSVGAVAALASVFLAGCSGQDHPYHRYCTDAAGNRVADDNCVQPHPPYRWYYTRAGRVPRVGERVSGGSEHPPGGKPGGGRPGGGDAPGHPPAKGGFGGHGGSGGG